MKALLIKPADGVTVLDFPEDNHLDFFYKHLECDCINMVTPYGLDEEKFPNFDLVVDDEGLFKEEPQLNFIASALYGYGKHGQPIVGNALLIKHDGPESVGATDEELEAVINALLKGEVEL